MNIAMELTWTGKIKGRFGTAHHRQPMALYLKGTVNSQPIQTASITATWNMAKWVLKQQSEMEARQGF